VAEMGSDYKVLPVAPVVFKVLAGIGAILGVVSCIVILVGGGTPETPRWMGIIVLVVGTVYFFIFMVASEVVKLLLDINQRIK